MSSVIDAAVSPINYGLVYYGGGVAFSVVPGGSDIVQEGDFALLQEDGFAILTEVD